MGNVLQWMKLPVNSSALLSALWPQIWKKQHDIILSCRNHVLSSGKTVMSYFWCRKCNNTMWFLNLLSGTFQEIVTEKDWAVGTDPTWRLKIDNMNTVEEHGSYFDFLIFYFCWEYWQYWQYCDGTFSWISTVQHLYSYRWSEIQYSLSAVPHPYTRGGNKKGKKNTPETAS